MTENVIATQSPAIKQMYYPVSLVIQQHINKKIFFKCVKDKIALNKHVLIVNKLKLNTNIYDQY